jgi:hypothetical protein
MAARIQVLAPIGSSTGLLVEAIGRPEKKPKAFSRVLMLVRSTQPDDSCSVFATSYPENL